MKQGISSSAGALKVTRPTCSVCLATANAAAAFHVRSCRAALRQLLFLAEWGGLGGRDLRRVGLSEEEPFSRWPGFKMVGTCGGGSVWREQGRARSVQSMHGYTILSFAAGCAVVGRG